MEKCNFQDKENLGTSYIFKISIKTSYFHFAVQFPVLSFVPSVSGWTRANAEVINLSWQLIKSITYLIYGGLCEATVALLN